MKSLKKDLKVDARKMSCARTAVFAGSFDPFTLGHLDIVTRGSALFDKVWVLVAQNSGKKNLFDSRVRARLVNKAVAKLPNVEVAIHGGLTVDFMKSVGAKYLLRGIRSAVDLDMEQSLAWNNRALFEGAETVCLLSASEHLAISSTAVREILASSADKEPCDIDWELLTKFVPASTVNLLKKEFGNR